MVALIPVAKRLEAYSISTVHFYGSLLFAIPHGKPYTSIEKLYFPFAKNVWMCLCAIFMIAAGIIVGLKMHAQCYRVFFIGKSNPMPFFNMINVCLGGTVTPNSIPIRNFARTILLIWMISTLVLRNAYQGKLFNYLRSNQQRAPFYKLDQLYESNLKLYLYDSFYPVLAEILPEQR